MFATMNYLAIVVAAVAARSFGALWHRAFATRWMDALGKTKEQLTPGGRRPLSRVVIAFAADVVMAAVLASLIRLSGEPSILSGLATAGGCWLGFVLTTTVVTNGYAGNSSALSAVASWHWLGVLLVTGGVIGAFG